MIEVILRGKIVDPLLKGYRGQAGFITPGQFPEAYDAIA